MIRLEQNRRLVWTGIVWVLALSTLTYGIGYTTKWIVTTNNSAYVAFLHIPGDFTTHGVIQIVMACLLLYGLVPVLWGEPAKISYLRVVLAFPYAVYCGLTAIPFLLAPLAGGTKNPGWVAWTAFSAIGFLLALLPPPEKERT